MAIPKLQSTKDYSRFELCQFNRSVTKKKNLLASMKKHGFIPAYALHCVKAGGNTLQIKAGHHRFECAQELGIPVYFVVCDDDATIHELEISTNNWTIYDYMESYIRCGIHSYVSLREYHQRTGIPLSICISVLGGESAISNNLGKKFKNGTFEVLGEDHAEQLADLVGHCRSVGIDIDNMLVSALSRCLRVSQFSPEVFKLRATSNPMMFSKCRNLADQMGILENVYNFKATSKNRLPLCFLADQAMSQRCAIKTPKAKK